MVLVLNATVIHLLLILVKLRFTHLDILLPPFKYTLILVSVYTHSNAYY
jgi:hypothetical protein